MSSNQLTVYESSLGQWGNFSLAATTGQILSTNLGITPSQLQWINNTGLSAGVTNISIGTGLSSSVNPIVSTASLQLANTLTTGVSLVSPFQITVNQQGQITSSSNLITSAMGIVTLTGSSYLVSLSTVQSTSVINCTYSGNTNPSTMGSLSTTITPNTSFLIFSNHSGDNNSVSYRVNI
jgi:hypothetical protein